MTTFAGCKLETTAAADKSGCQKRSANITAANANFWSI